MKKNNFFIALLLLIVTFNSYNMEQTWQPPRWAIVVGGVLLGAIAIKMLWQPQQPFQLEDLPPEMQDKIMQLLTINTNAESLNVAAQTINSLAQANKELNEYINDSEFCLKLIKHLAEKFNCSDQEVAEALQTKEAKRRLTMQKKLLHLTTSSQDPIKDFKILCQQNIDMTFTYYGKGHDDLYTPLIFTVTNHYYGLASNIIIYAFNKGINITNQFNSEGNTALILCIKDTIRLGGDRYAYQRDRYTGEHVDIFPIYFDCLDTIMDLLAGGADPELANLDGLTPLEAAQQTNNLEIINLIQKAIETKYGKK